jgi:arylsulfatase A-like enzyme
MDPSLGRASSEVNSTNGMPLGVKALNLANKSQLEPGPLHTPCSGSHPTVAPDPVQSSVIGGILFIDHCPRTGQKGVHEAKGTFFNFKTITKKGKKMANLSDKGTLTAPLSRIRIGLFSALIAGATVGILESIIIVTGGSELNDWWVFCYATVVYGLLALPIGFGFGVAGAILSVVTGRKSKNCQAFSCYFSLTFTAMLLVIGRFRIIRDVYHEIKPGLSFDLKLLVGGIVVFFVFHLILRKLLSAGSLRWMTRTGGTFVSYILLIVATAILSLAGGPSKKELPNELAGGTAAGPNVLLIIIDTLRADHLPVYGYDGIETPAIDRLFMDGILYKKAFAQASWTKPSIASIMTGLYPSTHQAIHKANILPDDVITLAESLEQAGYHTIGIPNNENIFPVRNFQQGFQVYEPLEPAFFFFATESAFHLTLYNQLRLVRERFLFQSKHVEHYYQDAREVNEHAIEWLDRVKDGSFFLFIHYMDPHDPYFPHPYDGTGYARVNNPNPPPDMAQTYLETYDGEIVYLDNHLDELFGYLDEKGLYEDLMIVLTADHGEEFFEHEGWWHGTTLYEEQINVPLIVKLPGNEHACLEIEELVRLIDIAPSVLSLVGADVPPLMQGLNILPDSLETVGGQTYVFSEEDLEGNILQSYRGKEWKLIIANKGNPRGVEPEELFDLSSDPGEATNLSSREQEVTANLRAQMMETSSSALKVAVEAQEKEFGDVERERLKALGYVQ